MVTHTLYAYVIPGNAVVDGALVLARINAFIAGRQWACPDVWAVDQKAEEGEGELGLNVALPEPFREPPGWFADVEAIVAFCLQVLHELECEWVIGIADAHSRVAEDIIEIDTDSPNIEYLKKFLGVEPPKAVLPQR